MRVLILDGDSNAARAVVQSLGRAGYVICLAAKDTRASAFASRYVHERATYPDPLVDKEAFKAWIVPFQRDRRFSLIIPSTECTLVPLHELRGVPEIEGVAALPPAAALETAIDKEAVRALASSLGIPVPENLLVEKPEDLADDRVDAWLADGGAVVVKSVRSKVWSGASAHDFPAKLLTSRAEVDRLARDRLAASPVQIQRWIPGRGVGIEVLARRGKIVMSFAHERVHEYPLTGGASPYRKAIVPPPALLRDAEKLIEALGWHGVAMVEFRAHEESGRYWLMEINARFWGSLPLAIFAGADFPAALAAMILEDRIPTGPPPRTDVYARYLRFDVTWTRALLGARGKDPRFLLTRPILTTALEWGRLLTGKETLDGASLADPGPILAEIADTARDQAEAVTRRVTRLARLRWARIASKRRAAALGGTSRLLVICYGNICRSAYAVAKLRARPDLAVVEIRQGGFHPREDRRTPSDFAAVALDRGVDLSWHRSRLVTRADLAWADAVLIMDEKNFAALADLDRSSLSKAVWLGALDGGPDVEIADPYGEPEPRMRAILDRMDRCLDALAARISARG